MQAYKSEVAWGKLEYNCSLILPAEELGNIKSNRQIAKQKLLLLHTWS